MCATTTSVGCVRAQVLSTAFFQDFNLCLLISCSDRPIASLAFHAQGDLLAVASGHKVTLSFPVVYPCLFLSHGFNQKPWSSLCSPLTCW